MAGDKAETETKVLVLCSMRMMALSDKYLRLQKEQVDVKLYFVLHQLPSPAFKLDMLRQKYEPSLKIATGSMRIIYGTPQSHMVVNPLPGHLFIYFYSSSVLLLRAKCCLQ